MGSSHGWSALLFLWYGKTEYQGRMVWRSKVIHLLVAQETNSEIEKGQGQDTLQRHAHFL
jgi:hypothetical protein